MLVIFLFGVLSLCASQAPDSNPPDPKYVINIDSEVYTVGDRSKEYIDTTGINCERYNESVAYMYGHFEVLKDMPGDLICEVIVLKEASGKLEAVFSLDICDFCTEMGDESSDWRPYLKYMGMPTSCPFKAQVVPVTDMIVDMGAMDIKDQHCGPYVAEMNMYHKTGDNCKNDRELNFKVKLDLSIERQ